MKGLNTDRSIKQADKNGSTTKRSDPNVSKVAGSKSKLKDQQISRAQTKTSTIGFKSERSTKKEIQTAASSELGKVDRVSSSIKGNKMKVQDSNIDKESTLADKEEEDFSPGTLPLKSSIFSTPDTANVIIPAQNKIQRAQTNLDQLNDLKADKLIQKKNSNQFGSVNELAKQDSLLNKDKDSFFILDDSDDQTSTSK